AGVISQCRVCLLCDCMAIHRLQVASTCPGDSQQHAMCGRCLREQLQHHEGIRNVTVEPGPNGFSTLVLDYDPRLVTLGELDEQTRRVGLCLSPNRAKMVLGIEGMVSPRSEQAIEAAL